MKKKTKHLIWIIPLILIVISGMIYLGMTQLTSLGYDGYSFYDKSIQTGVLSYEYQNKCLESKVYSEGKYLCSKAESKTDKWIFLSDGFVGGGYTATSETSEKVINGKLRLTSQGRQVMKAKTTKIQKSYNIKSTINYNLIRLSSSCSNAPQGSVQDSAIISVFLNEVLVLSDSVPVCSNINSKEINIYYSILEDKAEIAVAGNKPVIIDMSKYAEMYLEYQITGGAGYMDIELKQKIPESCKIDENSVLVFDDFSSPFTREDVTYEILSLCPQSAALPSIRDIEKGTLTTDEKGEIYQKIQNDQRVDNVFINGQYQPISDKFVVRFQYITKYIDGMPASCPIGYSINAKTKQCEQVITQEQPTEIVLQCKTEKDCWLPSNCQEITASCTENKCQYSNDTCDGINTEIIVTNEKLVYQEILKQETITEITPVYIRDSDFVKTFSYLSPSLSIGEQILSGSVPTYDESCGSEPSKKECYRYSLSPFLTNAEFNKDYKINEYLTANCVYSGSPMSGINIFNNPSLWKYSCKFTLSQFMAITPEKNDFFILQNSDFRYNFAIDNKLYNFNNAGYYLDCSQITGVQTDLPIQAITKQITKGQKEESISLKTNEIATYSCTIKPFVKINADDEFTYLGKNEIKFSYSVVDMLPSTISEVPETQENPPFLMYLGLGIGSLVIIIIFFILSKIKE